MDLKFIILIVYDLFDQLLLGGREIIHIFSKFFEFNSSGLYNATIKNYDNAMNRAFPGCRLITKQYNTVFCVHMHTKRKIVFMHI